MFAKVTDNQIEGTGFTVESIRKTLSGVSLPKTPTDEILNSLGYYRIIYENAEGSSSTIFHSYTDPVYSFDGKNVICTRSTKDMNIEEAKAILKQEVKIQRVIKESSGTILKSGHKVNTARDDQAMIQGLVLSSQIGIIDNINFKTADGFITLDKDGIIDLAKAVSDHIQSVFNEESERVFDIDQCQTIAELEQLYNNWELNPWL